jgi:hypothetical protein
MEAYYDGLKEKEAVTWTHNGENAGMSFVRDSTKFDCADV